MYNLELFEELGALLRMESRYCSDDGILLKNAIVEDALQLKPELIRLLLTNERLKNNFFADIDGITIFDKVKFQKFIMNKRFLPDSYTSFKNKIGLIGDNEEFLAESREVVLSWPYKDCVLEGGQTKEDAKRNEIFWNEILAPDQITRLTEPKVLTNFKKYSIEGEETISEITKEDNLIIKGNNLLALHSLAKTYKGKVKLIYIDPPYNTGSDSFQYNDNFNHSSWLTFMKNRLEVAKELLSDDGVIFITCDDNESGYLRVLLDEIFKRENFVANFIWKHRKSSQNDIDVSLSHNYNYCYAKNRNHFKLNSLDAKTEKFTNPDNDIRGAWVADPFDAPNIRQNLSYEIINPNTGEVYFPPSGRHWRFSKEKYIEALNENRIIFGKTGKSRPQYKRFKSEAEVKGENVFTVWDDISTATDATKEIIKLFGEKEFSTPKPESLIERIIKLSTSPNDIILDFHLGSGTTAAVAHKMGRRYIGIEQMDYIEDIAVERLKKVIGNKVKDGMFDKIEFDQGGISKAVDWKGGGSFVYCELAKANQNFIDEIDNAETKEQLNDIWDNIQINGFLSWKVNPKSINEDVKNFSELSIEDTKRFLIDVLDKNLLYIPLSEIDNLEFNVSEEDKQLTNKFYGR